MGKVIKFVSALMTKGELAEQNIKDNNVVYDCALPQEWLDNISKMFTEVQLEKFGNMASHFVYVYDNSGKQREEYVMPLTKTGCKILGSLALYR